MDNGNFKAVPKTEFYRRIFNGTLKDGDVGAIGIKVLRIEPATRTLQAKAYISIEVLGKDGVPLADTESIDMYEGDTATIGGIEKFFCFTFGGE